MTSSAVNPRSVVVTGADGFIGRHVCTALARDGWKVRGVVRSSGPGELPGVERFVVSDLVDRMGMRAALEGASAVVHLAARVHASSQGAGDAAMECRRVNVDGTALLLDESVAAGVKSLVFASSVKAVANESDRELTEETPPQPADPYGESKLEAERLIRVTATRESLHAPILRLPNVYGPGMKANMVMLFKAVEKGIPLPFGSVHNRRSFAYIDNVTAAILLLLTSPAAARATVYVSDEEDLSTPELIAHISRALGRPSRLVNVPSGLLHGMAGIWGLLSRFPPFHLNGDSLTAMLGSLFVDTSRLRETTGYRPPMSVEKGMLRTAEWFNSRSQVMS
ncbi:MAG: NAD-dependent epimerase/dehydratase family protein [Gemmatimonadales bacterium]